MYECSAGKLPARGDEDKFKYTCMQFLAGGWELLFVLLGFLFILEAGYIYLYKKGVLDWTSIKD